MSVQEAERYTLVSTTIAASGTSVQTLDPKGATTIALVIDNTGAGDIDSVTVEKSPLGNKYGPDSAYTTAIGSVAAGSKKLLQISAKGFESIRLTFASTAGTTFELEGKAVY